MRKLCKKKKVYNLFYTTDYKITLQTAICEFYIQLTMPRRPVLSDFEKGQIVAWGEQGMSIRKIAEHLHRGKNVVHSFLGHPEKYGTKKSPGRPEELSKGDKGRLILAASKGHQSAR